MKVAALVTEAHGGRGGIAAFDRDLLEAIAAHPRCERVTALARLGGPLAAPLPQQLVYAVRGCGKTEFVRRAVREFKRPGACDLVVCGHLNLLPVAWLAARRQRAPLALVLYGIEAWRPHRSALVNRLARRVDEVVAISEVTRRRFFAWSGARGPGRVLPVCVDLQAFSPGPKSPELLKRYGLGHNRVVMTLGRFSAAERYKGVDELLEALPVLARAAPDLAYLVCGDGDDLERLREKSALLGLTDRVVFAGHVPEAEKADHYRLADVFAMPSRGEGFGIVFLEALACGIPVVAGNDDGGREALREGAWGELVDPGDPSDLARGVRDALARGRGAVPAGLDELGKPAFLARVTALVDALLPVGARG